MIVAAEVSRPDAGSCRHAVRNRRLLAALNGAKRSVVYQDCRHSVGNVPAANLGPFHLTLVADWMAATLQGQPFPDEQWYVEASGRIGKSPLA